MATYYVDGAVGNDGNAGTSQGSGNAWATISHALATITDGDLVYVKASATYGTATGFSYTSADFTKLTRLIGYTSSPGDNGQATLHATANVTNGFSSTGNQGISLENLIIDANGFTGTGVKFSATYRGHLRNVTVSGWTNSGVIDNTGTAGITIFNSKITGCSGSAAIDKIGSGSNTLIIDSQIVGNTTIGYLVGNNLYDFILGCIIANNSGGSSVGIECGYGFSVINCAIYNNGSDGIYLTSDFPGLCGLIYNNILALNGGYGINWPDAQAMPTVDYNAFYSNTSGARNLLPASPNDVTLSGNPFTNPSGGDFTLNNTAGAGAACRNAGFPGALLYGGTGYLDIGALRHQDPAGGGSGINRAAYPSGISSVG